MAASRALFGQGDLGRSMPPGRRLDELPATAVQVQPRCRLVDANGSGGRATAA